MTFEEAKETIKSNYPPSHYSRLQEALDMAMEEFDKAEKYRWHDLRKNPNDLPNDNDFKTDYIIILDNNTVGVSRFYGRGESCQGYYEYPNGVWQIFEYYAGDVIAWKEIGPLDEVIT